MACGQPLIESASSLLQTLRHLLQIFLIIFLIILLALFGALLKCLCTFDGIIIILKSILTCRWEPIKIKPPEMPAFVSWYPKNNQKIDDDHENKEKTMKLLASLFYYTKPDKWTTCLLITHILTLFSFTLFLLFPLDDISTSSSTAADSACIKFG